MPGFPEDKGARPPPGGDDPGRRRQADTLRTLPAQNYDAGVVAVETAPAPIPQLGPGWRPEPGRPDAAVVMAADTPRKATGAPGIYCDLMRDNTVRVLGTRAQHGGNSGLSEPSPIRDTVIHRSASPGYVVQDRYRWASESNE